MMEYKWEETNEAAAPKKTLESNDAVSEDVQIRRLIEERGSTSKGEKQRLKDWSKQIKMHQGQEKSRKTARHPKNT